MERYCSTGQSPQRAVVPTEGEGEREGRERETAREREVSPRKVPVILVRF
jgi:hypothetical protein